MLQYITYSKIDMRLGSMGICQADRCGKGRELKLSIMESSMTLKTPQKEMSLGRRQGCATLSRLCSPHCSPVVQFQSQVDMTCEKGQQGTQALQGSPWGRCLLPVQFEFRFRMPAKASSCEHHPSCKSSVASLHVALSAPANCTPAPKKACHSVSATRLETDSTLLPTMTVNQINALPADILLQVWAKLSPEYRCARCEINLSLRDPVSDLACHTGGLSYPSSASTGEASTRLPALFGRS